MFKFSNIWIKYKLLLTLLQYFWIASLKFIFYDNSMFNNNQLCTYLETELVYDAIIYNNLRAVPIPNR